MNSRFSKPRFSLWILPAGLIIGVILFIGLLVFSTLLRPQPGLAQEPTAILTVISAPTSTPTLHDLLESTTTPTPSPSSITIGGIGQGIFVQISGTGGNGLRLRKEPGTQSDVLFLGYEAEVFKVTDGPQELDGYIWWYLTAPYDVNRSGWAASNYLSVIETEP